MRRCETDLLNWFSLSIGPVDNRDLDVKVALNTVVLA
jgi:hypothetical protein